MSHPSGLGQKPPVEVDVQFDQPSFRLSSLDGRFLGEQIAEGTASIWPQPADYRRRRSDVEASDARRKRTLLRPYVAARSCGVGTCLTRVARAPYRLEDRARNRARRVADATGRVCFNARIIVLRGDEIGAKNAQCGTRPRLERKPKRIQGS